MNFLSLFSGIGGLDLGLERAGMRCVAQVEIDPFCRHVLAKHWPHVRRFEDVKDVSAKDFQDEHINCIAGGFPCQDISRAGKRAGLNGARSGLWAEFHRIICDLRPDFAIVENSPALLDLCRGAPAPIGTILGDLAASGFDAEWACIPAAAVGAHHLRIRCFIVAYPHRERREEFNPATVPTVPIFPGGLPAIDSDRYAPRSEPGFDEETNGGGGLPYLSERFGHPRGAWRNEPDVARVVHGVSGRLDRNKGLGNAVVPQVAEWIGRRILDSKGHLK
jgi:DNA (cytosine-5)-methyltransferase 1